MNMTPVQGHQPDHLKLALQRILPLYPIYWIALISISITQPPLAFGNPYQVDALDFTMFGYLLYPVPFSNPLDQTWYMSAQVLFVVLQPLLHQLIKCSRTYQKPVVASVALLSSSRYVAVYRWGLFAHYWAPLRIPSFYLGMAVGFALQEARVSNRRSRGVIVDLLVVTWASLSIVNATSAITSMSSPLSVCLSLFSEPYFAIIVYLLITTRSSLISTLCCSRVLHPIGRSSYVMYITQYNVLYWMRSPIDDTFEDGASLTRYLCLQAAVITVAVLLTYLVNEPIEKRINQYLSRPNTMLV